MRVAKGICMLILMFMGHAVPAADGKQIAVLDTELIIDNKPAPHFPDRPGEIERAGYMTAHIRKALDLTGDYELVSLAQAEETVTDAKDSQQYLHKCKSCVVNIGRALGVDYVATVWVQVVSNLIINFNFVVRDARTGETVMTSFIDIRGNNNSTWRTGTNYLLEKFFTEYHDQVPENALKQAQSVWPAG